MIVADDLTGAADTGVKFCGSGDRVSITLSWQPGSRQPGAEPAEHIVLDTDSRSAAAHEAAGRVRDAVIIARHRAPSRWFKKIDSTMHGHVAAELTAFLDALPMPDPLAVVCPAVPNQQRILRNGELIAGAGTRRDVVAALREGGLSVSALAEHRDADLLSDRLRALPSTVRVVVVDAVDDRALHSIATAVLAGGPRALVPVGSAGLAGALATQSGYPGSTRVPAPSEPVIAVLGSPNPVTRAQAGRLVEAYGWPVFSVGPDTDGVAAARRQPRADGVVLLADSEPKAPVDARRIEHALAVCAAELYAARGGWLLLSGGAVARAVLTHIGARAVHLLGELADEVPLGRTWLAEGPGPLIATKAGGFGTPDTLVRIFDYRNPGES